MKASELIIDLQKMIDQHGDLPVFWTDDEWAVLCMRLKDSQWRNLKIGKVKSLNQSLRKFMTAQTNLIKNNQVMDHDIVSTLR